MVFNELYHHGILGMKWGKRNGPPYPLSSSQKSTAEKKLQGDKEFRSKYKDTKRGANKLLRDISKNVDDPYGLDLLYGKYDKPLDEAYRKAYYDEEWRKEYDKLEKEMGDSDPTYAWYDAIVKKRMQEYIIPILNQYIDEYRDKTLSELGFNPSSEIKNYAEHLLSIADYSIPNTVWIRGFLPQGGESDHWYWD